MVTPWLYGATTSWAIEGVTGGLGVVLLLWVISLVVDRRRPLVPGTLLVIVALIALVGWWMVLNAHGVYDSTFHYFMPLAPISPALPGAVDQVVSLATMWRVTALLGIVLFVADLAQRRVWLTRLWYAVVIAGAAIALLGLLQKGSGAEMIFWESMRERPLEIYPFFASFYYHANAGAYLNLILPLAAGLAVWVAARGRAPVARAVWFTALVVIGLAILSNTSRMAQVVSVILVLVMLAFVAKPAVRLVAQTEKRMLLIGAAVVLVTLVAIGQAAQLHRPLDRWQSFGQQLPVDARWLADRAALGAVGDAKWLGFGAGSFRTVFPHYQELFGKELQGTWRFLHEDYLQTLLEWGWIGSALIAALFFGGIAVGARNYFKAREWSNRQRILLLCCLLALAGVAIHAVVDFPLQILSIQLLVATYLGVCWASATWRPRTNNQ